MRDRIGANTKPRWLWMAHCETSTGVLNDLPAFKSLARDLGADQKRTFREVTLPLVWTGIFGSFLFGFTLTWNDFDRTVLLQNGYETQTLPIQIGTMTFSRAIQPDLYALGAATTAVSLFAIAVLTVEEPEVRGRAAQSRVIWASFVCRA